MIPVIRLSQKKSQISGPGEVQSLEEMIKCLDRDHGVTIEMSQMLIGRVKQQPVKHNKKERTLFRKKKRSLMLNVDG